MVQWLRLHAANAGAAGLIHGWGTKIPTGHEWHGQKHKKEKTRLALCFVLVFNRSACQSPTLRDEHNRLESG